MTTSADQMIDYTTLRCSEFGDEPLPGTAKPMTLFLALEYLHGWGHDIMDDDVLGDLAAPMRAFLKENKAGMQFIRKPGRAGQHRATRKLFVARTDEGTCYCVDVAGPEDVLKLDVAALSRGQWGTSTLEKRRIVEVKHPIMLVCTHGKRDKCCALKGRPVAAGMQACFYGDEVWETSHAKGHRFAPTMILLPWGYSYGRLTTAQAINAVKTTAAGTMYAPGLRGRGCWDPAGQVAEIAVVKQLGAANVPVGSLRVTETPDSEVPAAGAAGAKDVVPDAGAEDAVPDAGATGAAESAAGATGAAESAELAQSGEITDTARIAGTADTADSSGTAVMTGTTTAAPQKAQKIAHRTVYTADGRKLIVTLEQVSAGLVMASCGTPPKEGKSWVARDVVETD